MRRFLLISAVLLMSHTPLSAEIFSWTDDSGNIVYGDSPPENVAAKPITPPKLTILENFANRYPSQQTAKQNPTATVKPKGKVVNSAYPKKQIQPYTSLSIIAPRANQSIRANDGDVSVAIATSPKLRKGDQVVIYLNDQLHSKVSTRIANLSSLDRGEYVLAVAIQDATGRMLIKSATVPFNVQKSSVLTSKVKPYNPYADDPSQ